MSYLSIFGLEFEHNIAIIEISTLEFVKNEFFTHAVNFGTGFAFLKVRVRIRVRFINYSLLKALQISHKKVNKAVVLLCKSQDILPAPAFLIIYNSFVRTHLDYGGITSDTAFNNSFHPTI